MCRRYFIVVKKVAFPLLLASLGFAHAAGTNISVSMSEMKFAPMNITLKAGQKAVITVTNTGKVVHELQAYNTPKVAPKDEAGWDAYMQKNTIWLPSKDATLTINGKAKKGSFFEVELQPGEKGVLIFTPTKKGTFELACHKPSHYEGGMKGTVTVK